MIKKRKVEIFSAGCPACEDAVSLINRLACDSCDVRVLDMNQPVVSKKAKTLGVLSVPAMVIDGELAECCRQGINEESLKAAGLGQPLSEN